MENYSPYEIVKHRDDQFVITVVTEQDGIPPGFYGTYSTRKSTEKRLKELNAAWYRKITQH